MKGGRLFSVWGLVKGGGRFSAWGLVKGGRLFSAWDLVEGHCFVGLGTVIFGFLGEF